MNAPRWLSSSRIPAALIAGLTFIAGIYVSGVALLLTDPSSAFRAWIHEDGLVEWLTFVVLIAACCYAGMRAVTYERQAGARTGCRVWILIALLLLFGALEEISYGQRVFGIETPDFLLATGSQGADSFYNKQGETNLHNLVIQGVRVNKLVFGKMLALAIILYFTLIPVLYRCSARCRGFINHCGLPIIQNYQLVLYLGALIVSTALRAHDPKVNELLELVGCTIFLCMITHPFNAAALPSTQGFFTVKPTSKATA